MLKIFVLCSATLVIACQPGWETGALARDRGGNSGPGHEQNDRDKGNGGDCIKVKGATLPVDQIQAIVGAQGEVNNGVLDIGLERTDLGNVAGPMGVTFTSSFEIHGDLYFQPLSRTTAFLNGDLALQESEVNAFISALLTNGLVFQAFHQHTPAQPQIWFVHFRGAGDPLALAQAVRNSLGATATPLPQAPPPAPTTPLDTNRLATILHGDVSVGDQGVVTVTVLRKDRVRIDGVCVSPEAGISTTIEFKPTSGSNAEVVPDFSLTAKEVNPVVDLMLNSLGWYQGCLYNQETGESPQLYFDHMVKSGDAYELAAEIRQGLDLTNSK